ncbi:MAG: hypothetical protein ACI35S_02445 [Anaeroplasma sp.]
MDVLDKIELNIFGKTRAVTFTELLDIYKRLDDPNPIQHAIESFEEHARKQLSGKDTFNTLDVLKSYFKDLYRPYMTEMDYNIHEPSRDVLNVFASKIPLSVLSKFAQEYLDYDQKSQEILQEVISKKNKSVGRNGEHSFC